MQSQISFDELHAGIEDGHFICASWMEQKLSESQTSNRCGSVSMLTNTMDQSMPAPSRYVRVRKTPASIRTDRGHRNESVAFSSSGAIPSTAEHLSDTRLPAPTRFVKIKWKSFTIRKVANKKFMLYLLKLYVEVFVWLPMLSQVHHFITRKLCLCTSSHFLNVDS